jgi:hypothetical protein
LTVDTWLLVVIVIAVVGAIIIAALAITQARRRAALRRQFGPEYDRAVENADNKRKAEAELTRRAERREQFETRQLAPEVRDRYAKQWRDVQTRFVDAPADSVQEADVLVTKAMRECGYPVEGFSDRSDFVSVDHPHLAEDYRAAHRIAVAETEGTVSTEDRRQAMVHFRSLFDALLGEDRDREHRDREHRDREHRDREGREARRTA